MVTEPRYVTDASGNRIGVILDLAEYATLLDALEELDAVRAYDTAKADERDVIPLEQALAKIETGQLPR